MEDRIMPRYPVYIPSRSRYDTCLTAGFLIADGVPFYLVVEPQEEREYAARFGRDCLLVLPWSNLGETGLIAARNWIKAHATSAGHARHWQLDDNSRLIYRWYKGKRIPCRAGVALAAIEDFVDRYENIAIAGMAYEMFGPNTGYHPPPFFRNVHVYSCTLVLNSIPHVWRLPYNDDTDMCLQVLADGWCTVLVNAFMIDKVRTMTTRGGNTPLYQADGRLKMARALERAWPGVASTGRKYQRPQHSIKHAWQRFDTPLRLKEGIDLSSMQQTNEYGMRLHAVKEVKSEVLRAMLDPEHGAPE